MIQHYTSYASMISQEKQIQIIVRKEEVPIRKQTSLFAEDLERVLSHLQKSL